MVNYVSMITDTFTHISECEQMLTYLWQVKPAERPLYDCVKKNQLDAQLILFRWLSVVLVGQRTVI